MADPAALLATIKDALNGMAGINGRVYDGYVPDDLDTDAGGYILPYVVIWAGIGDGVDEPTLNSVYDSDGLVYDFQTTAVGPAPGHVRTVAGQVKTALTNLPAGTGRVKPNPDGFNQQSPIADTNTSPTRFYLPLQWRLQTN